MSFAIPLGGVYGFSHVYCRDTLVLKNTQQESTLQDYLKHTTIGLCVGPVITPGIITFLSVKLLLMYHSKMDVSTDFLFNLTLEKSCNHTCNSDCNH